MGYASYKNYLASPRWQHIRAKILNRAKGICEVCLKAKASQVHHRSYCLAAMLGKQLNFLVACCRPCHENAEFRAGYKVSPSAANTRMHKAAWDMSGAVLPGICKACRKNPTKEKRDICGRCKRDGRAQP